MMHEVYKRIIWSADVNDERELERYLSLMKGLRAVKLDRLFMERFGFGPLERLRDDGYRVFDDAKIIEIPTKLVAIAELHLRHKPWMLSCMAGAMSNGELTGGELDGLKRFADTCHAAGTLPCGVTVLTSKSPAVIAREFGGRSNVEQTLEYADALLEAGFSDIVCSPAEVGAIRAESRFDCLSLNTPGIRPSGSPDDDQERIGTPVSAIICGATRLIIGRPLTVGASLTVGAPRLNFEQIARDIYPYFHMIERENQRAYWREYRRARGLDDNDVSL